MRSKILTGAICGDIIPQLTDDRVLSSRFTVAARRVQEDVFFCASLMANRRTSAP